MVYATNALRLGQQQLHGATLSKGAKIYVFASSWSLSEVDYWYPGGQSSADDPPFDMAGTSHGGLVPKSWKVPSQPGTYTITATGTKSSQTATVTVTFVVA